MTDIDQAALMARTAREQYGPDDPRTVALDQDLHRALTEAAPEELSAWARTDRERSTRSGAAGTSEPPRRFHYLITISRPDPMHGSARLTDFDGTYGAPPGKTRAHAYAEIRETVARRAGGQEFAVIFFSLEPDSLDREG